MKQRDLILVKRYHPTFYRSIFDESHGFKPEIPISSMEEAEKMAMETRSCFGFYVYQKEFVFIDGKRFTAEPEKIRSVLFAKLFSVDEIKQMSDFYKKDALLKNLAQNKQDKAIKTRTGAWLDIDEEKNAEIIVCEPYF